MSGRTISAETRAAIERLLEEGGSCKGIARQLGVHHVTVAKVRDARGLPVAKSGRKSYSTLAEAFRAHTEPVDGGHLRWTGSWHTGAIPQVEHQGRTYSAFRIAFTLRTGREPVGQARPGCDYPHCVAPACVADQTERERDRATFDAIFGGGAS